MNIVRPRTFFTFLLLPHVHPPCERLLLMPDFLWESERGHITVVKSACSVPAHVAAIVHRPWKQPSVRWVRTLGAKNRRDLAFSASFSVQQQLLPHQHEKSVCFFWIKRLNFGIISSLDIHSLKGNCIKSFT
jgi:hypothetical protein